MGRRRKRKRSDRDGTKILGRSKKWWRKQSRRWVFLLRYHYARCERGDIDSAFLDELWSKQEKRCPYCERGFGVDDWVLEHMTPICRGGTNSKENVCFACHDCNTKKYTMTAEEFLQEVEPVPFVLKPYRKTTALRKGESSVVRTWTPRHRWRVLAHTGRVRFCASERLAKSIKRSWRRARGFAVAIKEVEAPSA